MENTIRICSSCGTPLPPDAPAGLCPACLLQSGALTPPAGSDAPSGEHPASPATPPKLIPGQTFGDYRIVRLLGKGGMGEVFAAEHLETGRKVALKIMGHAFTSEDDRKRFMREARLAASINHPNVVYVHGGAEVGQIPIIAMELAPGGTLNDRLKKSGPLPVAEAVEAMLQVIAGLEAAHAAGVLHRDIKPSNCFVSADGTVKVGDFGLSVSTIARGESLQTATGAVLGTPAYASPEQLRGEELDVASDIYSVGATLFHLLTGRLPFQTPDFVKLITEVLDKPPPAPSALRKDLPEALSRLVLRCLAKERKARFTSYAELRDALLPFTRSEEKPAPLGPRLAAGLVDSLIASLPMALFGLYWGHNPQEEFLSQRNLASALAMLPFFLWYFGYYTLCEGYWGAGVGKALLGLHVVGLNRDMPGYPRVAWRTFLFMLPELLPAFIALVWLSGAEYQYARNHELLGWSDALMFGILALLYGTMWKRFNYVAILDRLSGTRVLVRQKTERRPALRTDELSPVTALEVTPATLPQFGYFRTLAKLWEHEGESLYLAEDAVLRRQVWVQVRPAGSAPASYARRELARPGRLRWLCGGENAAGVWEAFDAVAGAALVDLGEKPRPWNAVRFWLLDLAQELQVGMGELEPPPPLELNRIWISRSGTALLLDFPAPAATVQPADQAIWALENNRDAQRFLDAVARFAMEPHELPAATPQQAGVRAPVPLHARGFLDSLARATFDRFEFVIGNLQSLTNRPAVIGRARRFWSLFLVPATFAILCLIIVVAGSLEDYRWRQAWRTQYGDLPSLRGAMSIYRLMVSSQEHGLKTPSDEELARAFLVAHYAKLYTNAAFWENREISAVIGPDDRRLLDEAMAKRPLPSPELMAKAKRELTPQVEIHERMAIFTTLMAVMIFVVSVPLIWGLVELASAVVGGKARIVDLLGMAVVNRHGERASRLRLFWRWVVVWAPLLIITPLVCAFYLHVEKLADHANPIEVYRQLPTLARWVLGAVVTLGLTGLGAAIYTVCRPERALQDRLAGTWVVLK